MLAILSLSIHDHRSLSLYDAYLLPTCSLTRTHTHTHMEAILEEEEEVEEDSDEEEAGPVHDAIDSSDDTEDKREEEADDDDDEEEHDESIKARMPMFRLLFYGWNDAALRHLIENIVGLLRELPVDDPRLLPMRQRALIVPPLRHLLGDRDARFQTSTLVAALERFAYGHASTDRDEIFSPNDHERCTWRRGLLLIALRRCHYVRELLFTDKMIYAPDPEALDWSAMVINDFNSGK